MAEAKTRINRPPRPHLRPRPQVRVQFGASFPLGPGKVRLIEAIRTTGSISAAARQARMSYRRAWVLIDEVNRSFREPLVETATGGKGGGGARVTPMGEMALRRYHDLEDQVMRALDREMDAFGELLAPQETKT
ncbi:MAG: LysR family transcriptional regulator [Proteobacteria bacterium]|nr:LysR family transcriptional regulator [Pseudomonadota bacterium]MDA1132804.1 LysR family transcriptional regulator [Pseudomonadota bacterium]